MCSRVLLLTIVVVVIIYRHRRRRLQWCTSPHRVHRVPFFVIFNSMHSCDVWTNTNTHSHTHTNRHKHPLHPFHPFHTNCSTRQYIYDDACNKHAEKKMENVIGLPESMSTSLVIEMVKVWNRSTLLLHLNHWLYLSHMHTNTKHFVSLFHSSLFSLKSKCVAVSCKCTKRTREMNERTDSILVSRVHILHSFLRRFDFFSIVFAYRISLIVIHLSLSSSMTIASISNCQIVVVWRTSIHLSYHSALPYIRLSIVQIWTPIRPRTNYVVYLLDDMVRWFHSL